jgi:hypothetical protein
MNSSAERFHTRQRLRERYALEVDSAELFQLAKRLAHGQGRLLHRQSRFVAHWALEYRGVMLRLVFDSRRRCILTALPCDDSEAYAASRASRAATPLGA